MRKLILLVSGVARGEPPQAAMGVVLSDAQGNVHEELAQTLGRSSREAAAYRGLLAGLRLAAPHQPQEIVVYVDHPQVANHILGVTSPRELALQHLNRQAQEWLRQFPRWRVSYVDPEVCRPARRRAEHALYEERQAARERANLRQEILSLLDQLSLEDLRRTVGFLHSLESP